MNAGTGTSTFSAAVGATTALASLSMDPADPTLIIGGSIITSGAQTYGDAVTLGANTTMTGHNVQFGGTVDGPYSLTINDAGVTAFSGVVGGLAHLTSLTTAAGGTVDLDTTAVTTTGAQTFNDNMVLGSDVTFSGVGLTFGGSIDGAHAVTANASIGGVLHTELRRLRRRHARRQPQHDGRCRHRHGAHHARRQRRNRLDGRQHHILGGDEQHQRRLWPHSGSRRWQCDVGRPGGRQRQAHRSRDLRL